MHVVRHFFIGKQKTTKKKFVMTLFDKIRVERLEKSF